MSTMTFNPTDEARSVLLRCRARIRSIQERIAEDYPDDGVVELTLVESEGILAELLSAALDTLRQTDKDLRTLLNNEETNP